MKNCGTTFRKQIISTLCNALQPLPNVLAAWESGSAAFNHLDEFSDIDLNFLIENEGTDNSFFSAVESALESVSPVLARHSEPPGRYFKLKDGGDFLLVDVCIYFPETYDDCLNIERHGQLQPLFDKGQWLSRNPSDVPSSATIRGKRQESLKEWFSLSQMFVRKTINRGQEVEALAAFWGYTLKPLVELLRMRYCPARWDFGMRYLKRDLPGPAYERLQDIIFVKDYADIEDHLARAVEWGEKLLHELPQYPLSDFSSKANEQCCAVDVQRNIKSPQKSETE